MSDEYVRNDLCDERRAKFDERFARDKERIDGLEKNMQEISALNIKMGQMLEQHDKKLDGHEKRLESLEKQPSKWLDRIITVVITALLTGAVAFIWEAMTT